MSRRSARVDALPPPPRGNHKQPSLQSKNPRHPDPVLQLGGAVVAAPSPHIMVPQRTGRLVVAGQTGFASPISDPRN
ncbi:hypothetical protein ACP70R_019952 [Stipagrostis hirtigluma subsp. patula]